MADGVAPESVVVSIQSSITFVHQADDHFTVHRSRLVDFGYTHSFWSTDTTADATTATDSER
jgi:hypothetical protein